MDDWLPPGYEARLEAFRAAQHHEMSDRWRHMDEIVPGLWLGPDTVRCLVEAFSITLVVSAVTNVERRDPEYKSVPCEEHRIELDDDEDADLSFEMVTDAAFRIHAALGAGKRVLVHCAFGRSRSASLCAAYLIASGRAPTYEDALAQLSEKRPCVRPNAGFAAKLRAMETDLHGFIL
jgi:atypical dual specificity phosphatase